jgi:uncharacterized integral membrane protein
MIAAAALAALATLFAVLNLDNVEVNWILGTWSTPMIVVIAVAALAGAGLDRLVIRRKQRRIAKAGDTPRVTKSSSAQS